MTKPRFTPDPLPDGLDPSLASFLQRQFDRINDWWPKDLEDRVKTLEKSYPYIGGTWPIVDYSTIEFNGSAIAEQLTERAILLVAITSAATSTTGYAGYGAFNPVGATNIDGVTQDSENRVFLIDGDSLWTSEDGLSFTEITHTDLGFKSGAYIKGVSKSNGVWIAAGTPSTASVNEGLKIVHSSDLITWTEVYSSLSWDLQSVPFSAAFDGNGNCLVVFFSLNTGETRALYSTDNGLSWQQTNVIRNGSADRAIYARYANSAWFMCGVRSNIYRSTDLVNWSLVYTEGSSSTRTALGVVYGEGLFVANQGGNFSKILTSPDGITWSNSISGISSDITSLHYDNTWKFALTAGTNLLTSSDGLIWTNVSSSLASMKGAITWDRLI